jgi:hypothetical protein
MSIQHVGLDYLLQQLHPCRARSLAHASSERMRQSEILAEFANKYVVDFSVARNRTMKIA